MSDKPAMRFLSFANDKEDAEKQATLKEAARKIEEAIAREKSLEELIDYVAPEQNNVEDLANDTRPLYIRLQEQKNKKKEVDEDAQKLSNFVSKLDEEDAEYLNEVEKKKREDELRKRLEVYDALESKRRLDEQKAIEEEKRRKELLIGSNLNRKDSQIKSRLSQMIKMKPKSKTSNDPANKSSDNEARCSKQVEANIQPKSSPINKRPNEPDDQSSEPPTKSHAIDKRDQHDSCTPISKSNINTKPNLIEHPELNPVECSCPRVMKCLGVLPSLPQSTRGRHSSEEESDNSDDELEQRIVPQIRKRK